MRLSKGLALCVVALMLLAGVAGCVDTRPANAAIAAANAKSVEYSALDGAVGLLMDAAGADDYEVFHIKPGGPLDCSDGQVLHDWCLAGYGIAWRSTWEVEHDIAAGRLVEVLADFAAPPNGIYAVFPQRKHLPLRVRLWIDFLKHNYGQPAFWQAGANRP